MANYTQMRLDTVRLAEPDYIERRLFELFVIFHRYHKIQPSCEYVYATARINGGSYTYLRMTRARSHREIALAPTVDFLTTEKVAAYVAEIEQWNAGRGLVVR